MREMHERMMSIRHKVVAHSDHDELMRVTLGVKEDETSVTVKHMISPMLPKGYFPLFLATIDYVSVEVVRSISKYIEKVERDLGKKVKIDRFAEELGATSLLRIHPWHARTY